MQSSRVFWLVAIICGLFQAAFAAEIHTGPYLESVNTDSEAGESSVWVIWEMRRGESQPRVEYRPAQASAYLESTGESHNTEKKGRLKTEIHEVELAGLDPDTKYYYSVDIGDDQFSDTYSFRTPPLQEDESGFSFVATSDEQPGDDNSLNDPRVHTKVIEQIIKQHCVTADLCPDNIHLVLSAGDNVGTGGKYDQHKWWFDVRQELQRHVPSVVAPGNHDYFSDSDLSIWRSYHHNPRNGRISVAFPGTDDLPAYRDDHEERWYYLDYSNVRFISMDSNGYNTGVEVTKGLQNDWLDAVLLDACVDSEDDANIDFVIAQFHHNHSDEWWVPLDAASIGEAVSRLEQFSSNCGKPSAHIYGHTHNYNRGQSRDHNHSIVNASTAGGSLATNWQSEAVDFAEVQTSDVSYGWVSADVTAGENPSIHFFRYSIGDNPNTDQAWIIDDFIITQNGDGPSKPSADMATVPGLPSDPPYVILEGSAYSDPVSIDHQSSHWQVALASAGDFDSPAAELWEKFENWLNGVDTQAGNSLESAEISGLAGGTDYVWRVRYRNQNFHWSDWSESGSFSTDEPLGASFSLDKSSYARSEPIMASFSGGPGNTDDWIGIYSNPGNGPTSCSSNGSSTIWLYTNNTQSAGGNTSTGSVTFSSANPDISADSDWPLPAGNYIAYFLEADGYCQLGNAATFSIEQANTQDTVGIVRATYRSRPKRLLVEATSSAAPDAVLTVEGFGVMTYSSDNGIYTYSKKVSTPPGESVTVVSDQGGEDTALVSVN